MKQLLLFSAVLGLMTVISCSKSSKAAANCNSNNYTQEFQDELDAVSNATSVYASDPTTENCEKFVDAYLDYIDALESWEDCAISTNQEVEWRQALESARQSAEDIQC